MAAEGHHGILCKLRKRAEEDAKEWAAEISLARENGKVEGQEEMRKVLESQHKTDLEGWTKEKQELVKKIDTLEAELKDSKELRQLDKERLKNLEAQVKVKDDRVNNLEGELAQSKKKVDEVVTLVQSWMGSGEGDQQEEEEKDDDELSNEESEARLLEPVPSKRRRLFLAPSPPDLLPEKNHGDKDGLGCECGVDYDTQAQLKEHLRYMEAGRRYVCHICKDLGQDWSYPKRKGLKTHMREKHNTKIYGGGKRDCRFCGVAFKTVEKLEQHLIRNPKTGRLVCPAAFDGSRTPAQEEDQGVAKTE